MKDAAILIETAFLKADLHVHTEYSRDCTTSLERVISGCQRHKLDCIAVTDHNEVKGAMLLQEKAPFKVIIGEEIMTDQGEIIGYFLTRYIRPGMSPARTVDEIKNQGGLVCVPHPFDRIRRSRLTAAGLQQIIDEIDIVEVFNSRNIYSLDNKRARDFAVEKGTLFSVGTDAHWPWEIGRSYISIPDFSDAGTFRAALEAVCPSFTGTLKRSGLLVHMGTKTLKILRG